MNDCRCSWCGEEIDPPYDGDRDARGVRFWSCGKSECEREFRAAEREAYEEEVREIDVRYGYGHW